MNSSSNLRIALISLVTIVLLAFGFSLLASAYRPSDALIKALVEKEMARHLKGAAIKSITILRGNPFPNEAHNSKTPYGTQLYPVLVTVTYISKPSDGSDGEPQQITRTLNLYRDASHHWVDDAELH